MDKLQFRREEQAWGVLTTYRTRASAASGEFAPQDPREWRTVFRQWATEYSLQLTRNNSIISRHSIVNHRPVEGGDCLDIVLLILGVFRFGEPLDLDDPLTYSVWLDFLNDHQMRTEHWEWWKEHRGEFRYL